LYDVALGIVVNVIVQLSIPIEEVDKVGATGIVIVPAVGEFSFPAFTDVIVIVYEVVLVSPVKVAELDRTPFTI
jgi:hypothetical protein